MRGQSVVNLVVRGALRAPWISRLLGRRLITLYLTGRKTGRRYAVPVAYHPTDGGLLLGTSSPWQANLATGDVLPFRLLGHRRLGLVTVDASESGVVSAYGQMSRANRTFAGFNDISFDSAGNPDDHDLHRAWKQGARVIRLEPR